MELTPEQQANLASFLTPNRFDVGYERVLPGTAAAGTTMDVDVAAGPTTTSDTHNHNTNNNMMMMDM